MVWQVVHLDLKSANVLLDRNYMPAKIGDLGLSRQVAEGSVMTNHQKGAIVHESQLCPLAISCLMALPDVALRCHGKAMHNQCRHERIMSLAKLLNFHH